MTINDPNTHPDTLDLAASSLLEISQNIHQDDHHPHYDDHHFEYAAIHSPSPPHTDDSTTDTFSKLCNDFSCCGESLKDLHALIEHYEQCHVRIVDDGPGDGSQGQHCIVEVVENNQAAFDTTVIRSVGYGDRAISNNQHFENHCNDTHSPIFNESPHCYRTPHHHTSYSTNSHTQIVTQHSQPHNISSYTKTVSKRPYKCKHPHCPKTYKNPNGLKYHLKHGHCTASSPHPRPHTCPRCSKTYKNPNGLRYHLEHGHCSGDGEVDCGGINEQGLDQIERALRREIASRHLSI